MKPITDGEWIRPLHRGFRVECCCCGATHKMDFRVVKGHIEFRAFKVTRRKRKR